RSGGGWPKHAGRGTARGAMKAQHTSAVPGHAGAGSGNAGRERAWRAVGELASDAVRGRAVRKRLAEHAIHSNAVPEDLTSDRVRPDCVEDQETGAPAGRELRLERACVGGPKVEGEVGHAITCSSLPCAERDRNECENDGS